MRRRQSFTMIEVVVSLFLVALLSVAVAGSFSGGNTMSADLLAQATVDAALDAVASAAAVDGAPPVEVQNVAGSEVVKRLASETPEITFLDAASVPTKSTEASVAVGTGWDFGAASVTTDGSCFLARVSFAADPTEATRLYAVIVSGSTRICNGQQALDLSPLGSQPSKGPSWKAPLVIS